MQAIGFQKSLPINATNSLFSFESSIPVPAKHDLLVEVSAVSVNPVDVGVRKSHSQALKKPKILGWDAVGIVKSIGSAVSLFQTGDRVFYAGSFKRPGSNSQYQLVDERIAAHAPKKLTDAQAAAMPLTALTAWEALFEQLEIQPQKSTNQAAVFLIINGAGGVGSIATQLAHQSGLTVIASASRSESIDWTLRHGADLTVNHRNNLVKEVQKLGFATVDYILELNDLDGHWNEMADLIKPGGKIVSITENRQPVDLKKLTRKRVKFAWEWMFSKSYYQTADLISQHQILEKIANLLDQKKLQSTLTTELSPINVTNLKKAHQLVESNQMIGKVVVSNHHS